ncbi:MAG: hypothetical protein ACREBG_15145 [Pyrinomonadaceae bacterium]
MTICPCCGFKFKGDLSAGCAACGAHPVGEALPKPEHELPSYARSLLLSTIGSLMVLVFLVQTILALLKNAPSSGFWSWIVSLGHWSWIAAAETAAWRMKWIAIPATILVLWGSRKIYRSMIQTPSRFCGLRYARCGLLVSALVPVLIAVLIGVTVPERLQQRQRAIEAGIHAQGYTLDRALFEYRLKVGRLPNGLEDLKRELPDPDGSIAAALSGLDAEKAYKPTADLAAKQKPLTLRGTVIRNASLSTAADDTMGEGLAFTNYELRLPGEDKLMGTEDDWIVRDGLIKPSLPTTRRTDNTASTTTDKP